MTPPCQLSDRTSHLIEPLKVFQKLTFYVHDIWEGFLNLVLLRVKEPKPTMRRLYLIAVKKKMTYEDLQSSLQKKFTDYSFYFRSGTHERYILVKTPYPFVAFNIWYCETDKILEITDTIPYLLFRSKSRDKGYFNIQYYNKSQRINILMTLNEVKRRKVKNLLFRFLLELNNIKRANFY